MSNIGSLSGISSSDLLKEKAKLQTGGGDAFAEQLKSALNETNELQVDKEVVMSDMATGQVKDLHQAALAISKAETNMKLMLEIRNKALSAYKDISSTQL